MSEPLPNVMENSVKIAWDYLDRTGELGDPELAARVLRETVEGMIRLGERRPLMLSNRAIEAYRRSRNDRHLVLIS